jgi:hypothetical protein
MATYRQSAAETVAARMLVRGARNIVVECQTQLSRYAVRGIRIRECGDRPGKPGPLPSLAASASPLVQMHRSLLAGLYRRIGGSEIYEELNIEHVIVAYDIYCYLAELPDMVSFDDAWTIARDLRAKSIEIARCTTCSVAYLSSSSGRTTAGCPYCEQFDRTAISGI